MLGDVGEPELVRRRRGEVPAHQIIVGRRAGLGTHAGLGLPKHDHQALSRQIRHTTRIEPNWSRGGWPPSEPPSRADDLAATVGTARGLPLTGRPAGWCQLEGIEGERRRHRAADEDGAVDRSSRLPGPGRDDRLGPLAGGEVGAEHDLGHRSIVGGGDRQEERAARVVVPDLGRVDPVPVRRLVGAEQEVDGGAAAASTALGPVPPGLGELAALGMRFEAESVDGGVGIEWRAGHGASLSAPRRPGSGGGVEPMDRAAPSTAWARSSNSSTRSSSPSLAAMNRPSDPARVKRARRRVCSRSSPVKTAR